MYGKWYLYILTTGIQFCRGILLSPFGQKRTRGIQCLMEIQMLKGKYYGMIKLGVKGFRDIVKSIEKLKITQK